MTSTIALLTQFGDECLEAIDMHTADKSLDSHQLADAVALHVSSLVCLHTVFNELELIPEYKSQIDELTALETERLGEKASHRDKFQGIAESRRISPNFAEFRHLTRLPNSP